MDMTELDTFAGEHEAHLWVGVRPPELGGEPVALYAIREGLGTIYPLTAPPHIAFSLVMAALIDSGMQR